MIKISSIFRFSSFSLTKHFVYLLAIIVIQACASPPTPRPKAITEAEYFLQQGTSAFYNDKYPSAARNFSEALKIYRSIDERNGILKSYINLMKTSLAISNLEQAHQQLTEIEAILSDQDSDTENYRQKVTLLKVKLLFKEEKYTQAIQHLQPLLPTFNTRQLAQQETNNTINIIASMARLAVTTQQQDATLWLQRLQLALNNRENNQGLYKALYLRIKALQRQHEGDFDKSKFLLNEALTIYHSLAYRRGIAASLQQLADLEIQQLNWDKAGQLLQRALKIHLWTLNQRETKKVLQLLIKISRNLQNEDLANTYTQQLNQLNEQ